MLCEWLTMSLRLHCHPILIFFLFYKPDHWLFIQATLEPNPVVATNGIAMESHEETQNRILPILCEWLTMSLWMHRHPILIFFLFYKPDHWLFIQATLEPNPVVATKGIAMESHWRNTESDSSNSLWMVDNEDAWHPMDQTIDCSSKKLRNQILWLQQIAMESHEETQNRILPIFVQQCSLWMHRHPILNILPILQTRPMIVHPSNSGTKSCGCNKWDSNGVTRRNTESYSSNTLWMVDNESVDA